jgi:hypothetical protein
MTPGPSQSGIFSWRPSLVLSLAIAAGWLILRLAVLGITGPPDPKVHDEFAYLLGSDTFAHGRLTNPASPLAPFFASAQTLYEPTYSSKYPPGQSLFLAAGQVFFGHPIYGVVIEGTLMMFLLCLMLCLWTTLPAAAIVSTALALFFQPPMYWVDSYWGGCATVCGAALILIAIGWYRISANPWSGCFFAAGGMLLFVTRPYEGGVFFITSLLLSLWGPVIPRTPGRNRGLMRAALYGTPVIAAGLCGVAAHDFAVTRNPFLLPYQLHLRTQYITPVFIWQPVRQPEPEWANPRLAAQFGSNGVNMRLYRSILKTPHGYLGLLRERFHAIFGFLPLAPLIFLPLGLLDRRVWASLALTGAGVLAHSVEVFHQVHYMAPSVPALVLLYGVLFQRALAIRVGRIPVGWIAAGIVFCFTVTSSIRATLRVPAQARAKQSLWPHERTEMIRRLAATGKQNLVIVRYPDPSWNVVLEEWVYNGADIDRQPVIFAYDLGPDRDKQLLDYYRGRTVWLLTFDPRHGDRYFLSPWPG